MRAVTYRKVDVDGIGVFYREAGPKDAPTPPVVRLSNCKPHVPRSHSTARRPISCDCVRSARVCTINGSYAEYTPVVTCQRNEDECVVRAHPHDTWLSSSTIR
jgi:hypothetical protein